MIPLDLAPNLIDQVYARILEAITDRTLLPGQRIRQNELAEQPGVSSRRSTPKRWPERVGFRLQRRTDRSAVPPFFVTSLAASLVTNA